MTRLLLSEWTKLRTVQRWVLTMVAAVVLTVGVTLLNSAGGGEGGGDAPPPAATQSLQDAGHLRYVSLAGDGSLTARVVQQIDSVEWAKAGLILRTGLGRGAPYVAIVVTPKHGVHMQSGYGDTDIAGSSASTPRWLRLDRRGGTVTGYESADGRSWHKVGTIELSGGTAQLGLFVASPDKVEVERQFGGEALSSMVSLTRATFDEVRADPTPTGKWRDDNRSEGPRDEVATEVGGTVTMSGSGDVGPTGFAEDRTKDALTGVLLGLMAVVALGVLFVTSEYKRGMILSTFAASPRRGRVLIAKALVLGSATFVAGLVASFGAYAVSVATSALPLPPLSDGAVLRAVIGTAALLAVVAVFALGVATLLRRSAPAITVVLLLLLVPPVVATGLPLSVAVWLERITPAAGFAIQDTVWRYDTAIGPWAGFGVLCAYTVVVLAFAARRLERRDT
jgi:hypothetical protein